MLKVKEKISHRFFAAFFIVAVIPIFVMGIGLYLSAERTLMNLAFMHIRTIAQDRASRLSVWCTERLDDIKLLSGSSAIKGVLPPRT